MRQKKRVYRSKSRSPYSKRYVDSVDRGIIRLLYRGNRPMTGHQISRKIGLTAPAINSRLSRLKSKGITKKVHIGKPRRIGTRVSAPSKILWDLNMYRKKKR